MILPRFLAAFSMFFVIWIVLTEIATIGDIILGVLFSAIIAFFMADMMLGGIVRKKSSPRIWIIAVLLLIYNIVGASLRKHLDVIRRIFSLKMKLRPGVIKVPFKLRSDLGAIIAANLIALTPGTIVLEIDSEKNYYYVHWINVEDPDPNVCRKKILDFEEYVGEVIG